MSDKADGTLVPVTWPRLLLGLIVVYFVLQWTAEALGSIRGEFGLAIGALVVAACVAVERLLFGRSPTLAARELGLGLPHSRGIMAALGVALAMVLVLPLYAAATGASMEMYQGWVWLVPGLFAQAGIAEEILFRGYLFRHVRVGRSFWRAALLAMGPFVLVHLFLFLTLPWTLALAAVTLAVVVSFPLAYLFELGGGTIWAPALVHFTIQGAIKVVAVPGDVGVLLPLVWMGACALLPYAVFLVPRARENTPRAPTSDAAPA